MASFDSSILGEGAQSAIMTCRAPEAANVAGASYEARQLQYCIPARLSEKRDRISSDA